MIRSHRVLRWLLRIFWAVWLIGAGIIAVAYIQLLPTKHHAEAKR